MRGDTAPRAGRPEDPDLTPQRRKIVRVIEDSQRSRGYAPLASGRSRLGTYTA